LCNQVRSFLRKFAAEDSGYVEQRSTAADQTNVMRTVADQIAVGAQNGIIKRDAVEKPGTLVRNSTRTIHHSTSGEPYVIRLCTRISKGAQLARLSETRGFGV
jgi:hypothetical protein